eukprot:COSAG02_NODE_7727_length_2873_cov_6.172275_4_plen_168_part_00
MLRGCRRAARAPYPRYMYQYYGSSMQRSSANCAAIMCIRMPAAAAGAAGGPALAHLTKRASLVWHEAVGQLVCDIDLAFFAVQSIASSWLCRGDADPYTAGVYPVCFPHSPQFHCLQLSRSQAGSSRYSPLCSHSCMSEYGVGAHTLPLDFVASARIGGMNWDKEDV